MPPQAPPGAAPAGRAAEQADDGCSREQRRTRLTPTMQKLLPRLAAGCWPSSGSSDRAIAEATHPPCCLQVQHSEARQVPNTPAFANEEDVTMPQIYLNRKQLIFALVTLQRLLMSRGFEAGYSSLHGQYGKQVCPQAEASWVIGIGNCRPAGSASGPRHARC